jgi:outer membrane protein assembly factor BamA
MSHGDPTNTPVPLVTKSRKRLVGLCFAFLLGMVGTLHLPWVQDQIWAAVHTHWLKDSLQVEASRVRFNVFRPSLSIRGLKLELPQVRLHLDEADLHFGALVFLGRPSLRRCILRGGTLTLSPETSGRPTPSKEEAADLSFLNDLRLDQLDLIDWQIIHQGRTQTFSQSVEHLKLTKRDQFFQANWDYLCPPSWHDFLPDSSIACQLTLTLDDPLHMDFTLIHPELNLTAQAQLLHPPTDLGEGWPSPQEFMSRLQSEVALTLRPTNAYYESYALHWTQTGVDADLSLCAQGDCPPMDQATLFSRLDISELMTQFKENACLSLPLNLQGFENSQHANALLDCQGTLTLCDQEVRLVLNGQGHTPLQYRDYLPSFFPERYDLEMKGIIPFQMNEQSLELTAWLSHQSELDGFFSLQSQPGTPARFPWQGQLNWSIPFFSKGQLTIEDADRNPSGPLITRIDAQFDALDTGTLGVLSGMPPLQMEGVEVTASVTIDRRDGSYVMLPSHVQAQSVELLHDLADLGPPPLPLEAWLSGPDHRLGVELTAERHQAKVQLDLQRLHLHNGHVTLGSLPLQWGENWLFLIEGTMDLSGPLDQPELDGRFRVEGALQEQPALTLDTGMRWSHQQLQWQDLCLLSHQMELHGQFGLELETMDWTAELQLDTALNQGLRPLVPLKLPQGSIHFNGNSQRRSYGEILLAEQHVTLLPGIGVNLANVQQEHPEVNALSFELAGMRFDAFHGFFQDQQVVVKGEFFLNDPEEWNQVFQQTSWPQSQLEQTAGQFEIQIPTDGSSPQALISLKELRGQALGLPLSFGSTDLVFCEELSFSPIDIQWGDTRWSLKPQADASEPFPSAIDLNLSTPHLSPWFIKTALPHLFGDDGTLFDLFLERASLSGLTLDLSLPLDQRAFQVKLNLKQLKAQLLHQVFQLDELKIHYEEGWQDITMGGLSWNGKEGRSQFQEGDLQLSLPLTVDQPLGILPTVNQWGEWQVDLATQDMKALIIELTHPEQKGGFRMEEPDLTLNHAAMRVFLDGERISVLHGKATFNRRDLTLAGSYFFEPEKGGFTLILDRLPLRFSDFRGRISGYSHFSLEPDRMALLGELTLLRGFFQPQASLSSLLQSLFPEIPALALPDPLLQDIQLNLRLKTEAPLQIQHPLGYVECSSDGLFLGGDLSAPTIEQGTVEILEGSELNLSVASLVFLPSQVRFIHERPLDPFLHLNLEYMDTSNRPPLTISGYLSELEGPDPGVRNLLSLAGSYLINQVSSMMSLETSASENIYDTSFSFVIAKALGKKLLTRYVIPLDLQKDQRVEIGLGPFSGYTFHYARSDHDYLQLMRKFELGQGSQKKLRDVDWKVTPKSMLKPLKKVTSLEPGLPVNPTRLRRERTQMQQILNEYGYFRPKIQFQQDPAEPEKLTILVEAGTLQTLAVQGLSLGPKEEREMMKLLAKQRRREDSLNQRAFDQMMIEKGFFPGEVHVSLEENPIEVDFQTGPAIGGYTLSLSGAEHVLPDVLTNKGWQKAFIQNYLLSPLDARQVLRDVLAAQGYLASVVGQAQWNDTRQILTLFVDTGPPFSFGSVAVQEEPSGNLLHVPNAPQLSGQPFQLDTLQRLKQEWQKHLQAARGEEIQNLETQFLIGEEHIDLLFLVTFKQKRPVSSFTVSGEERMQDKPLVRLLDLPEEPDEASLVRAQKQLLDSGQFRTVRLNTITEDTAQGEERRAVFDVQERNPLDLVGTVSYDSDYEAGLGVQVLRRHLFGGPNDWKFSLNGEQYRQSMTNGLTLRHPFAFKGDVLLSHFLEDISRSPLSFEQTEEAGTLTTERLPRRHIGTVEYRYPINDRQRFQAGIQWQQTRLVERTEWTNDQGEWLGSMEEESRQTLVPLKFAYFVENLDSFTQPKKGMLLNLSLDWYLQSLGTDTDYLGARWTGNVNWFTTFGRWSLQERFKIGAYIPSKEIQLNLKPEDPLLFYLGGSTTLRGYEANAVGPLNDDLSKGIGGQAMVFWSQELLLDLGWYGLGLSPFLDIGQVWAEVSSVDFSEVIVTPGLGLVWDSKIGALRLDYAYQLETDQPERIQRSWHFRFGRVF